MINIGVLCIVQWAFVHVSLQSPAVMNPDVFFGKKPFCRLSEALEAALDVAQDTDEDVDVVIIPPHPSPDTDEEEGDDDATSSVQVNDVSGKRFKP